MQIVIQIAMKFLYVIEVYCDCLALKIKYIYENEVRYLRFIYKNIQKYSVRLWFMEKKSLALYFSDITLF